MKGGELRSVLYGRIAEQLDAMQLYQVLVFQVDASPRNEWFSRRGLLNNYVIRVMNLDDKLIIVRIK